MIKHAALILPLLLTNIVASAETTGGQKPTRAVPYRVYQIIQRAQDYIDEGNSIDSLQLPEDFVDPSTDFDGCLDQVEEKTDDIRLIFAALEICTKRHPTY